MKKYSPEKKWLVPLVGLTAILLTMYYPYNNRNHSKDTLLNAASRDIATASFIDTNVHSLKKVNDSIQKIIYWKRQRLTEYSKGFTSLFVGTALINECDSCLYADTLDYKRKYYISLEGYALRPGATYYAEGNNYYIENAVPFKQSEAGKDVYNSRKKTNTRLVVTNNPAHGITVLMPVSKKVYSQVSVFSLALASVAMIAGFWLFIILPFRILRNIANGKPFIEKNIIHLRRIGWGIIWVCLSLATVPLLIRWIMASSIPKDIYYPFWESLFDYRWLLFLGICVLIIAKAFTKGYYLQEHKDLTF